MTHTLGELAAFLGENSRGRHLLIEGIAPIDQATPREITLSPRGGSPAGDQSRAAAFIVSQEYGRLARPLIIVPHPYLATPGWRPLFAPRFGAGPVSAIWPIWAGSGAGQEVSIAPLVFIGAGARLGDRVTVMPGCVIGDEVQIGADTLIYPTSPFGSGARWESGASSTAAR